MHSNAFFLQKYQTTNENCGWYSDMCRQRQNRNNRKLEKKKLRDEHELFWFWAAIQKRRKFKIVACDCHEIHEEWKMITTMHDRSTDRQTTTTTIHDKYLQWIFGNIVAYILTKITLFGKRVTSNFFNGLTIMWIEMEHIDERKKCIHTQDSNQQCVLVEICSSWIYILFSVAFLFDRINLFSHSTNRHHIDTHTHTNMA